MQITVRQVQTKPWKNEAAELIFILNGNVMELKSMIFIVVKCYYATQQILKNSTQVNLLC